MKTLVNATAGFSLVVDALKAAEILEAVKAAGLDIGLTSIRGLLNGSVATAKGFEVVDVVDAPVEHPVVAEVAEEPVEQPVVDEVPAETPAEPEVTTWSMGANIDFLASKTARLTRKFNRVAKSALLAEVNAVDFVTTKVGRVVTDHIVMKKNDEVLYTLFPTKRSAHENIAEVYDAKNELLIRASWGHVVQFFFPEVDAENEAA